MICSNRYFLSQVLIVLLLTLSFASCELDSPCPEIFEYRNTTNGKLYGYVKLKPTDFQNIKLEIDLSVDNTHKDQTGRIELQKQHSNNFEDIIENSAIEYNVYFPEGTITPPKITKIVLNDQLMCIGESIKNFPQITVTLRHMLNTGYASYTETMEHIELNRTFRNESRRVSRSNSDTELCGLSLKWDAPIVEKRFSEGAHPWLAAIFLQTDTSFLFHCGGTLVSKKHVVTAGYCVQTSKKVYHPTNIITVLGREDVQKWSNDDAQIIQANNIYIHPDYKRFTADGNIAIIELSKDVIYSTSIRPICLWKDDANINLQVRKIGVIVGWGDADLKLSNPAQITSPIVSQEECLRSNHQFVSITSNRTFCAGYRNNSGPCHGSGGSGYLMEVDGRWTLRGITSTSLVTSEGKCDLSNFIVFVDVAQYMDWLYSILHD